MKVTGERVCAIRDMCKVNRRNGDTFTSLETAELLMLMEMLIESCVEVAQWKAKWALESGLKARAEKRHTKKDG